LEIFLARPMNCTGFRSPTVEVNCEIASNRDPTPEEDRIY
jgi:hypothetical protein